ncbi:MAG TPA: crotonase/enoyl-CoA hydratase family protein [Beijerinckiaceae bacterium]|nr:crotonase/enoyl-CoA hydratase family protein [Beijerinckiaceae bacterium]
MSVAASIAFKQSVSSDVLDAIYGWAGPLPQVELEFEAELKLLWLTIRPEPKPIFTLQLLDSVVAVQKAIGHLWADLRPHDRPVRFLAFRGRGGVFTLGGDLDFYLECIATGDRSRLMDYAEASVQGAIGNASGCYGSVITLSTIHAKALGGGIDAPRSCHIMIAERQASFCYPEIRFNHFPITAVPVLSRKLGPMAAEALLLSGDEISAEEFRARGGLEAVVEANQGEDWIRNYCQTNLESAAARLAIYGMTYEANRHYEQDLRDSAARWVQAMLNMRPTEISKLQRISQMQEKLLARMRS